MDYTSIFGELTKQVQVRIDAASELKKRLFDQTIYERYMTWDTPTIGLTGIWGIYGNGAYFENSTYILENGNTIEQQFSVMNGQLLSQINETRNDMSLEPSDTYQKLSLVGNWNEEGDFEMGFTGEILIYSVSNGIISKENSYLYPINERTSLCKHFHSKN